MEIKLVAQTGEVEHRVVTLDVAETVIGRHPSCHVRINNPAVSQRHCRVIRQGDRVTVEDLDSTNGTFLNDREVRQASIHHGDRLRVGPARFVFLFEVGAGEAGEVVAGDWLESVLEPGNQPRIKPVSPTSSADSPAAISARAIYERLTGQASGRARGGDEDTVELRIAPPEEEPPPLSVPLIDFPATGPVRVRVGESHGIALAQLSGQALVEEGDIQEVVRQIGELIRAGHSRLVLDCSRIKFLPSQAVGALAQIHKRCQAAGGQLKLARLRPEAAEVLSVMGLRKLFTVCPEEQSAIAGEWPRSSGPAPSMAATLLLIGRGDLPGGRAPATTEPPRPTPTPIPSPTPSPPTSPSPTPAGAAAFRTRLRVMVGRARGRFVEITTPKFYIGRDPRCHLRPDSPTISRTHTLIEQRGGRVFVRDLGTTNGTIVNDRTLRDEEMEVTTDDRLQVGPLLFTLVIEPRAAGAPGALEDEVARLMLGESQAESDTPTVLLSATMARPPEPAPGSSTGKPPAGDRPTAGRSVESKVIGDVLALLILKSSMEDEETVGPVRYELQACLKRDDLPRRVVIDLGRVGYMSSRAVGMLLAYFQRHSQDGGALRFCRVQPEVARVFEQMRVPLLVDVFPTLEEALKEPWDA